MASNEEEGRDRPRLSERIGNAVGAYGLMVGGPSANLAPTGEWMDRWKALMEEVDRLTTSAEGGEADAD